MCPTRVILPQGAAARASAEPQEEPLARGDAGAGRAGVADVCCPAHAAGAGAGAGHAASDAAGPRPGHAARRL